MNEETTDILVDIPDEDLPRLAALYERQATWAPWMVGLIQTGMKWRKSPKLRNYVKFTSPNNCWEEDGTIVVIITYYSQDIVVFTLNENCVNLYKGLSETKRLNYDRRSMFLAIHETHTPTVRKVLEEKKIQFEDMPNFTYVMSPDEAKNLIIQCPSDVYVEKLRPKAAKEVNDVWPHKFPQSDKYIENLIEMNGGYGVFLQSNDELVAWVVKHIFGHLGMLQVKEEHKRKGYGSLVAKALSKEIAEEGRWSMGTIITDNYSSINMFEKLGFKNVCRGNYIEVDIKEL